MKNCLKIFSLTMLLVLPVFFLSGCYAMPVNGPHVPESVALNYVGEKSLVTFRYEIHPLVPPIRNARWVWTSSDESIVTLERVSSKSFYVIATGEGVATIRVQSWIVAFIVTSPLQ